MTYVFVFRGITTFLLLSLSEAELVWLRVVFLIYWFSDREFLYLSDNFSFNAYTFNFIRQTVNWLKSHMAHEVESRSDRGSAVMSVDHIHIDVCHKNYSIIYFYYNNMF